MQGREAEAEDVGAAPRPMYIQLNFKPPVYKSTSYN